MVTNFIKRKCFIFAEVYSTWDGGQESFYIIDWLFVSTASWSFPLLMQFVTTACSIIPTASFPLPLLMC